MMDLWKMFSSAPSDDWDFDDNPEDSAQELPEVSNDDFDPSTILPCRGCVELMGSHIDLLGQRICQM